MDQKEALIYFPLKEGEDIIDQWEELLFEHKKFFVTRPAIPKVFRSKLNKIEKQYQAYLVLGGEDIDAIDYTEISLDFKNEVKLAFQQMFAVKGQFKQYILQCKQFSDLKAVVENCLKVEMNFAQLWYHDFSDELERPVLSKEPDPMILSGAINSWDENENKSFEKLKMDFEQLPKVLKDEVKRLSLLLKLNT